MLSGGLLSILRGGSRSSGGTCISRGSRCGPGGRPAYAINAGVAVVGGVLAVYAAALGTGIVLIALILTFLDAAGITPTTRRLLGRRASQNVVSFGDREMPGALVLVAHYDSGPTRSRPLWPMFLAMVILLAMCVARVAGMSGVALTFVQFIATVVLIVYVALMLDIALSPASQGESDNASGVGVVLRLAERLTDLNYFGVHIVFTGAQKARAQGMRAFLQTHRKQFAPGETIVINIDAVGGGELRETKKEGPLLTVSSHPQLTGNLDSDPFVNREASDGYAAASAGLPSVTFAGTTDRLEEDNLAEAEEACMRLIEEMDEELS